MLLMYYLEDYDHKILYFVLEKLFDMRIGMGNDLRGDEYSDKFIFPQSKKDR